MPDRIKEAVKIILEEAECFAEEMLLKYKKQLATLSEYLSKNPSIDKENLIKLLGLSTTLLGCDKRYSDGLEAFIEKQKNHDFTLN